MYFISRYTLARAKKLGVNVYPSKRKNKKIDVYKNGYYITSVGDSRYFDYPMYIKKFGKKYAEKRRKLYKLRHKKDRIVKNSRGYYAANLLW